MKFLLINPNRGGTIENLDARAAAPPLGLMYIASVLVKNGHEIRLIDQVGSSVSDDKIIKVANHFNPDMTCFSTMGSQTIGAGRINDKIKELLPNTKTILGGVSPTFNDIRIFKKYPNVDFCIKGEGEESIIDLIKALKTKKFENVHGLSYKIKNKIKQGLPRKLIENIDKIPFPDRDLVKDIKYGAISGFRTEKFTTVLSSRGCPYACRYCSCSALVNRNWRARSVNNFLDELEIIQDQGYKNVLFFDDGLTIDNNRVLEITKGIKERGIKLNWYFEGRVDHANLKMFKEMVKTGAKVCYFGAESANQRILDWYEKGITVEQTKLAVKNARKAGMDFVIASFILGCPTETKEEIENTIKFITKLDIDFAQISRLTAYPGTFIWDDMVKKGYLDPDKYWENEVYVGLKHPESLPDSYLRDKVEEAYTRVLKNKKFKARHVFRLLKSRYKQKLFFSNLKVFREKDKIYDLIREK